jgi:threonylcarbamoyladenosine tRNA methylthiotransferase MtaB
MKIAFYTLGCKVNQYETQALSERFAALGFEVVGTDERADVYVINSCTVTGIADRKSRNCARRSKRANPDALTVLTGCYAELGADSLKDVSEIDMLVGNDDKEKLPELIMGVIGVNRDDAARRGHANGAREDCDVSAGSRGESTAGREYANGAREDRDVAAGSRGESTAGREYSNGVTGLADRARAYIKIEDGCDRRCSYCIVPHTRGGVRSRDLGDIVAEARALVANGYKELVLTGVNAALYGGAGGRGIIDVIDAVSKIGGDFRVRLSSLEPTVIDASYAAELLKREILCPHLHLSLQSGSDAVLSAMNRDYTMRDYLRIADVLRSHDPLFSITTDIIAGFPGETEADHAASLKAIRDVGFSRAHVFRYSRRPGTPAADMSEQIPSRVKAERSGELIAEGKKSANLFLKNNRGSRRQTLFYGTNESATYRGITDNDIEVRVKSDENLTNSFGYLKLDESMYS